MEYNSVYYFCCLFIPVYMKIISYDTKETVTLKSIYRNISHTLVGNKIVDNSDAAGASPVGTAPTTSSFST